MLARAAIRCAPVAARRRAPHVSASASASAPVSRVLLQPRRISSASSSSNASSRTLVYETTPPLPALAHAHATVAPLLYPKPTIVMAMSGGVDSSVAAALLLDAGFDVRALYMRNWDELDETGACSGQQDAEDVRRTCRHLGIAYAQAEFVRDYWNDVFQPMLQGYARGVTPNPDVLCNREIKFHAMQAYARQHMRVEWVATGHYARTQRVFAEEQQETAVRAGDLRNTLALLREAHGLNSNGSNGNGNGSNGNGDGLLTTRLLTSIDPRKDQTYFLSHVRTPAFDHVLFPVGDLPKPTVRELAARYRLPTAAKPDSMGLCFIGPRNFSSFLAQYVELHAGEFVTLDGVCIGQHAGVERYTVGQSAHISGMSRKWYVCGKRVETRQVVVVPDRFHPALLYDEVIVRDMLWIAGRAPMELEQEQHGQHERVLDAYCRLRSTEAFRRCQVRRVRRGSRPDSEQQLEQQEQQWEYVIRFVDGPHHTVSPGQTVALYVPVRGSAGRAAGDHDESHESHESLLHRSALAEGDDNGKGVVTGTGYHGGLGLGMGVDFVCLGGGPLDRSGASYHEQGRSWTPTEHYL